MTSVDSRIVTMKFDNRQFAEGVATTISSLQKLSAAVTGLPVMGNIFSGLSGATKEMAGPLATMETGVGRISAGFAALATVGVTALATVTNSVLTSAASIAKSFAIEPVTQGYDEYGLKLNAIQTIMAATGDSTKEVTAALAELNDFSDKTIYSFKDMIENIPKFTNAGVSLERSVEAIKGISLVAAVSGASANEAARAMYNFGQALSAGSVKLIDWKSIELANMGTTEFKQQLIDTAVEMGTLTKAGDGMYKTLSGVDVTTKNFSTTLNEAWLTSEALTKTLGKYTDQTTELGKKAFKSATDIKTLSQLMGVLKESIGSGWAESFELIFGNLDQAKELWGGVNNTIGLVIASASDARNNLLRAWAANDGREAVIEGISNAYLALVRIIRPFTNAFRNMFPPATGKTLAALSKSFAEFTEKLIPAPATMKNIRLVMTALFGVARIGWEIFKGLAKYVLSFIGLLTGGTGGILDFAGAIAKIIIAIERWILKGDKIGKFFDTIIAGRAALLKPIIAAISELLSVLAGFITSGADAFFEVLGGVWSKLTPILMFLSEAIAGVIDNFTSLIKGISVGSLDGAADVFRNLGDAIAGVFDNVNLGGGITSVGSSIAGLAQLVYNSIANIDFTESLDTIVDAFANMIDDIKLLFAGFSLSEIFNIGPDADTIGEDVSSVGESLKESVDIMGALKAAWGAVVNAFSGIGSIVGVVWDAISSIFGGLSEKLGDFVSGMGIEDALAVVNTAFFIMLYRSVTGFTDSLKGIAKSASGVLDQVTDNLKTMQQDVKANILLKIAAAIGILALSIFLLSKVETGKLAVSLGAIAGLIGALVFMMRALESTMPKDPKEAIATSISLTLMAAAMLLMAVAIAAMAVAVAMFGNMDMGTLAKGLGSVAAVMALMSKSTALMGGPKAAAGLLIAAFAIGVLAVSLTLFAGALKVYAMMDTGTIVEGTLKAIGVLVGLSLAMRMFPPNMLATAAAIAVLAVALNVLARALERLGGMSFWDIVKAMVALGGAMVIMAAGMKAMERNAAGAPAFAIMAAGIYILAAALEKLAALGIPGLLIAIGGLAAVLIVLGVAAGVLAATGMTPALVALGYAVGLLGAAMFLAGAGMALFAVGLATLATLGGAGAVAITALLIGLAEAIPLIAQQIGLGIIAFAKVIGDGAPLLAQAMGKAISSMLAEGIKLLPKFAAFVIELVRTILRVIRELTPDLINAGYDLLEAIFKGFINRMPRIAELAIQVAETFANEVGSRANIARLVRAGIDLIVNFLNGVADGINGQGSRVGAAASRVVRAVVSEIISAIGTFAGEIRDAFISMLENAASGINPMSFLPDLPGPLGNGDSAARKDVNLDDLRGAAPAPMQFAGGPSPSGLKSIGATMTQGLTATPVAKPVVNLSGVRSARREMDSMFGDGKMSVHGTQKIALEASEFIMALGEILEEQNKPEVREIKIEQINNSPKHLSASESYRNTKSAVALAKEAMSR